MDKGNAAKERRVNKPTDLRSCHTCAGRYPLLSTLDSREGGNDNFLVVNSLDS